MSIKTVSPQTLAAQLAPRDLNTLALLKDQGLALVEVKISQVSAARGHLLSNVRLPLNTRLLCVLRQGRPIWDLDSVFLQERDQIILLTEDEQAVRHLFLV